MSVSVSVSKRGAECEDTGGAESDSTRGDECECEDTAQYEHDGGGMHAVTTIGV